MFNLDIFRETSKDTASAAKSRVKDGGSVGPNFTGGMMGTAQRGHLHTLLLQVAIRVRYLIESWFLLKPLLSSRLSGYPSFLRPHGIPEADWPTLFCLRILWLIGGMYHGHPILRKFLTVSGLMDLLGWLHSALMDRIIKIMESSDFDWDKVKDIPLPEYDWKNGNPQEFYETFVKVPHPVVLRGFMEGTELMDFTYDTMLDKFGDEKVAITGKKAGGIFGKVKEVDGNPDLYVQNSEALFNKYPELWKTLQAERLQPYCEMEPSWAQFFIGRKGTGTPMHFAAAWNFFYMVDGTKKWYFVDPTDFYLSYPKYTSGYMAGLKFGLYPDNYKEDLVPAFKYCPYYSVELNPGDVLLNPAYWGHGVRNMTEKSVGVATRWSYGGVIGKKLRALEEDYDINRWASFNYMFSTFSLLEMHFTLRDISPRYDEHTTLREVGNSILWRRMMAYTNGEDEEGNKVNAF